MKKILVIEDEKDVRENLLEILGQEGYYAIGAQDGEEGVKLAWEQLPDLIISDIKMPRLDGFGVLARLINDPSTKTIPFILLTSRAEREDLRKGMELGADDFITKPFLIQEILNAIETRLGKQAVITGQAQKGLRDTRESIAQSLPLELVTSLKTILDRAEAMRIMTRQMEAEEVRQIGEVIYHSSLLLLDTINNFTEFSELEKLRADSDRCRSLQESSRADIDDDFVLEIAGAVAQATGRQSDLKIDIQPACLAITEHYLYKILDELVDNALKFSEPGQSIEIIGEFLPSRSRYLIKLIDHGQGMTPDQIRQVTNRYLMELKSFERLGVGMGLVIVRQVTLVFNGSFSIVSIPHERTVVEVELPV
jgi:two-component system sensor histidine kinase/response regulator